MSRNPHWPECFSDVSTEAMQISAEIAAYLNVPDRNYVLVPFVKLEQWSRELRERIALPYVTVRDAHPGEARIFNQKNRQCRFMWLDLPWRERVGVAWELLKTGPDGCGAT